MKIYKEEENFIIIILYNIIKEWFKFQKKENLFQQKSNYLALIFKFFSYFP